MGCAHLGSYSIRKLSVKSGFASVNKISLKESNRGNSSHKNGQKGPAIYENYNWVASKSTIQKSKTLVKDR